MVQDIFFLCVMFLIICNCISHSSTWWLFALLLAYSLSWINHVKDIFVSAMSLIKNIHCPSILPLKLAIWRLSPCGYKPIICKDYPWVIPMRFSHFYPRLHVCVWICRCHQEVDAWFLTFTTELWTRSFLLWSWLRHNQTVEGVYYFNLCLYFRIANCSVRVQAEVLFQSQDHCYLCHDDGTSIPPHVLCTLPLWQSSTWKNL
jgi:hypothetical protein